MRLSPEACAEDGIVSYPMTCHSGGTLDIYLEPVLPTPELVVLGESPVGQALGTLGAALGFRIHAWLESITTTDVWVVFAGMDNSEDHPAVRRRWPAVCPTSAWWPVGGEPRRSSRSSAMKASQTRGPRAPEGTSWS